MKEKATSSQSSSLSSKAVTYSGLALLVASVAMGANNCSNSEVDYEDRDRDGQSEPTRSAIGALLGVDMRDDCHAVSWGIPTIGIDRKTGEKGVGYAIHDTLKCDWRRVKDMNSPNQEFHNAKTTREEVAKNFGNTTSGFAGLGIVALGGVMMARSKRKRERKQHR